MQRSVFLAVVLLTVEASDRFVGNPMYTTGAVKRLNQHSLLQAVGADPDVGRTDALTDEAVVAGKFGATPVNLDTTKEFLKQRGYGDLGMLNDLISKVACVVRLEGTLGGALSPEGLQNYLSTRELATTGSKDDMLDRACDYQDKELAVRKQLDMPIADVSKDALKVALTRLGFISTSGTKAELVYRYGQALEDLSTIRKVTGDATFDTSNLKEVMTARGLSTDGTTSILLSRLAEYLLDVSGNPAMAGVSASCNMLLASSLCVEGGKKVVAPDAIPRGLMGKWTFDDAQSLDRTGNGNDPSVPPSEFGPGFNGNGASAFFDGKSRMEIPHSDSFANQDFCVTLWMYLLADYTGNWRALIHKGSRDNERTPTIFMEPQTRGIEFFVSTTDASQPAGERLWSNTFVPLRQWTHIAACVEGRNMRLYINGILDAENTTIGSPVLNQGPMYVGNDPWRTTGGVRSYVDELRYYGRSLSADDIQSQAQLGLGGVEPTFVELGCMGCQMSSCPKSCRRGYRMCQARDLFGGAYAVARGMGWANAATRIWTAEDIRDGGDTPDAMGLCMCCREEE